MWKLTHLQRPWCWERLKVRGEGADRGWGGWMASPTQWTWVLSKFRESVMDREAWRAAVHGVARIRRDWATELNFTPWRPPPRGLIPYPSLLHPEPLSLRHTTADLYLHRTYSNTALSQSLWGPCVLVLRRFVWALWVSLAGKGFDFKREFVPPTILLGRLLCPWAAQRWSSEWPRGDTPRPRLVEAAVLRWTSHVEIPHVQGQRNPSKTRGTGAAVRRYSTMEYYLAIKNKFESILVR